MNNNSFHHIAKLFDEVIPKNPHGRKIIADYLRQAGHFEPKRKRPLTEPELVAERQRQKDLLNERQK